MAEPLTAETIAEAATAPASASADGRSATAVSISEQLKAREALLAEQAAAITNPLGGAASGWNMLRPARGVLPGTTGRI